MGLQKQKIIDGGHIDEYCKIEKITIDGDSAYLEIYFYKDRNYSLTHRFDGFNISKFIPTGFNVKELNKLNVNPKKIAYIKLKESCVIDNVETNWFYDAIDILEDTQ